MNGHLVPHMLSNIQYHPCLLAGITLTAKALTAQTSLMNMLDALPEYSFVLEYITANIDQPVEVMGRWTEDGLGSFHYSAKPIDSYNIRKATYNGGVYALTSFENNFQYVGSTYNHYSRLGAHMAQFKQHFGPILDLTDKYQWASVNGGLTEIDGVSRSSPTELVSPRGENDVRSTELSTSTWILCKLTLYTP